MPPLPILRALMVLEGALEPAELGCVIAVPAADAFGGKDVVQHLVKDDGADVEARDPGLVENRMDADQALGGDIDAELHAALATAAAAAAAPTPGDPDIVSAIEVAMRDLAKQGEEIMMHPASQHAAGASARLGAGSAERLA